MMFASSYNVKPDYLQLVCKFSELSSKKKFLKLKQIRNSKLKNKVLSKALVLSKNYAKKNGGNNIEDCDDYLENYEIDLKVKLPPGLIVLPIPRINPIFEELPYNLQYPVNDDHHIFHNYNEIGFAENSSTSLYCKFIGNKTLTGPSHLRRRKNRTIVIDLNTVCLDDIIKMANHICESDNGKPTTLKFNRMQKLKSVKAILDKSNKTEDYNHELPEVYNTRVDMKQTIKNNKSMISRTRNKKKELPLMPVGELTNTFVPVDSRKIEYHRVGHKAMKYPVEPDTINVLKKRKKMIASKPKKNFRTFAYNAVGRGNKKPFNQKTNSNRSYKKFQPFYSDVPFVVNDDSKIDLGIEPIVFCKSPDNIDPKLKKKNEPSPSLNIIDLISDTEPEEINITEIVGVIDSRRNNANAQIQNNIISPQFMDAEPNTRQNISQKFTNEMNQFSGQSHVNNYYRNHYAHNYNNNGSQSNTSLSSFPSITSSSQSQMYINPAYAQYYPNYNNQMYTYPATPTFTNWNTNNSTSSTNLQQYYPFGNYQFPYGYPPHIYTQNGYHNVQQNSQYYPAPYNYSMAYQNTPYSNMSPPNWTQSCTNIRNQEYNPGNVWINNYNSSNNPVSYSTSQTYFQNYQRSRNNTPQIIDLTDPEPQNSSNNIVINIPDTPPPKTMNRRDFFIDLTVSESRTSMDSMPVIINVSTLQAQPTTSTRSSIIDLTDSEPQTSTSDTPKRVDIPDTQSQPRINSPITINIMALQPQTSINELPKTIDTSNPQVEPCNMPLSNYPVSSQQQNSISADANHVNSKNCPAKSDCVEINNASHVRTPELINDNQNQRIASQKLNESVIIIEDSPMPSSKRNIRQNDHDIIQNDSTLYSEQVKRGQLFIDDNTIENIPHDPECSPSTDKTINDEDNENNNCKLPQTFKLPTPTFITPIPTLQLELPQPSKNPDHIPTTPTIKKPKNKRRHKLKDNKNHLDIDTLATFGNSIFSRINIEHENVGKVKKQYAMPIALGEELWRTKDKSMLLTNRATSIEDSRKKSRGKNENLQPNIQTDIEYVRCVGIKNEFANCCLNSITQAWYGIPYIKSIFSLMPIKNRVSKETKARKFQIAYTKFFGNMISTPKIVIRINKVVAALGLKRNEHLDVSELNHMILDLMEESFNEIAPDLKNPILELFYGKEVEINHNTDGYKCKEPTKFCELNLPIYSYNNLNECLQNYQNILQSDNKSSSEMWIKEFPAILNIMLLRYRCNANNQMEKVLDKFTYPEVIYMDRYYYGNRDTFYKAELALDRHTADYKSYFNELNALKQIPRYDEMEDTDRSKLNIILKAIISLEPIAKLALRSRNEARLKQLVDIQPQNSKDMDHNSFATVFDVDYLTILRENVPQETEKIKKMNINDSNTNPIEVSSSSILDDLYLFIFANRMELFKNKLEDNDLKVYLTHFAKIIQQRIDAIESYIDVAYRLNLLISSNLQENYKEFPFQLSCVISHAGEMTAGHYIAFVKDFQSKDTWFKCNDNSISSVSFEEMSNESFGIQDPDSLIQSEKIQCLTAYSLLYRNMNTKHLQSTDTYVKEVLAHLKTFKK